MKGEPIELERAAFMAMHTELWAKYHNQYVAIYNGQLIDHDEAFAELHSRVRAEYPDTFVLMRRVEAEPEPVYHFLSPRLAENSKIAESHRPQSTKSPQQSAQ